MILLETQLPTPKNILTRRTQREKIMLFKTHPTTPKELCSHREHREHKEKKFIVFPHPKLLSHEDTK